jgi:hypothetical protein
MGSRLFRWASVAVGLALAVAVSAQNRPFEPGRMMGPRATNAPAPSEVSTIDLRNPSPGRFSRISLIVSVCPKGVPCEGTEPGARIVQSQAFAPGDSGVAQFGLGGVQQTCREARARGQVCSVAVAQCVYRNQQEFEEKPRCRPDPAQVQAKVVPGAGCQQVADGRALIDLGCMRSATRSGG